MSFHDMMTLYTMASVAVKPHASRVVRGDITLREFIAGFLGFSLLVYVGLVVLVG